MRRNLILTVVLVLIVAAIAYLEHRKVRPGGSSTAISLETISSTTPHTLDYAAHKAQFPSAVELVSPDGYINTGGKPIKLADYIGKKVVLLDFWTYSCINCQRTIPYLEDWYKKYGPNGFVVVGVHTPEFDFEKDIDNVKAAVGKFGITYPVALDSEDQTWSAYHNNYWPEEYLIDIDGLVREHSIGEGNYQETESNIQELLAERAQAVGDTTPIPQGFVSDTYSVDAASPETYFDWQRNDYLGNGTSHTAGVQTFTLPAQQNPNTLYLGGTWNIEDQFAENQSANASIRYTFSARNVYLVAGSTTGVTLTIYVDGKAISQDKGEDVDAAGRVFVKEPRLYKLIEQPSQETHTIEIKIDAPGLDAYTFTFG